MMRALFFRIDIEIVVTLLLIMQKIMVILLMFGCSVAIAQAFKCYGSWSSHQVPVKTVIVVVFSLQ